MIIRTAQRRKVHADSFTLIELLVVMAIIAILAAIILEAGSGVMIKAKRSRTAAEIQGMSAAIEGYKVDNGIYASSDGVLLTNNYKSSDGTQLAYQTNSTLLYVALSGQNYFTQSGLNAGAKSYMSFKANQVGNPSGPSSYLVDPWGYAYGYSTGSLSGAATLSLPYNGGGFFDLWSTAGLLTAKVNTNTWISNWQ